MTDENISDLDKRVKNIESYFKIALIVAAIFGVGGGFGAVAIKATRAEITVLEQSVSTLSTNVEAVKVDVTNAQNELANVTTALSDAVGTHLDVLESAKTVHLAAIVSASQTALDAVSEHGTTLESGLSTAVQDEINSQLSSTIETRLSSIENKISRNQVLAVVTVLGTNLVAAKTTQGVQYNIQSGVITFSNPDNSEYLVVVGDYGAIRENLEYRTDTNFLRSYLSATQFRLWKTTLDTGPRNAPPKGFTAIVMKVDG